MFHATCSRRGAIPQERIRALLAANLTWLDACVTVKLQKLRDGMRLATIVVQQMSLPKRCTEQPVSPRTLHSLDRHRRRAMFLGIDVGTGGTRAVLIDAGRRAGLRLSRPRRDPVRAHRLGRTGSERLVEGGAGSYRRRIRARRNGARAQAIEAWGLPARCTVA